MTKLQLVSLVVSIVALVVSIASLLFAWAVR